MYPWEDDTSPLLIPLKGLRTLQHWNIRRLIRQTTNIGGVPLPDQKAHTFDQVDVYLENFISTYQDITKESNHMLHHPFRSIVTFFLPYEATDSLCKGLISKKNIFQGGATWSTKKKFWGGSSIQRSTTSDS